jgi:hypothetical protein
MMSVERKRKDWVRLFCSRRKEGVETAVLIG